MDWILCPTPTPQLPSHLLMSSRAPHDHEDMEPLREYLR